MVEKTAPAPLGEWIISESQRPEAPDYTPMTHPNGPAYCDTPTNPRDPNFVHVLPHNDLFPHVLSATECWCKPELDDELSVVIHNSADGREEYESGRRRLN